MRYIDLSGVYPCEFGGERGQIRLPGTLDESGLGFPDKITAPWHPDEQVNDALSGGEVIATRLTRRHTWEGEARIELEISEKPTEGKRIFLECERARSLRVLANGVPAPDFTPPTLSTPRRFELTGALAGKEECKLTLISDNSYPGWPRADILASSAATDETQTNWNGILGYIRLSVRESQFITSLRAYPHGGELDIYAELSGGEGDVTVTSPALSAPVTFRAPGRVKNLPLAESIRRWDLDGGELYPITASLGEDSVTVSFGARDFGVSAGGQFSLNGKTVFLRGEANCAVFPETGHEPTDTESWREIISTYKSYGVNHLRFHSHCPPEAAFAAADELGMLMEPELSNWNPRAAFVTPESREYYGGELMEILKVYANHPSFVMLTLGNELTADGEGHRFMGELLARARAYDPTRLYASGSNNHYGQRKIDPREGFYTSAAYFDKRLRGASAGVSGWINESPDVTADYSDAMDAIRRDYSGPVVSFEVGQFEILPDFSELSDFNGVTDPANLRLIRENVEKKGLADKWEDYVSASGELSILGYRAEYEAALATPGLGGISLLGLQDFPGQGTALVGMLNSHLRPKPYPFADPKRFKSFFTGVLPLVRAKRFTFTQSDTLRAPVIMANYGKTDLTGTLEWSLSNLSGSLAGTTAKAGGLTDLGELNIPLSRLPAPAKYTLTVKFAGAENSYSLWLYPDETPACPTEVYETRALDGEALSVLSSGGRVLLAPDSTEKALPGSVKGQFTTDFWSVGTFPFQPGGMGMLVDSAHPVFAGFPTESHTDWQWRPMSRARALRVPGGLESIVTLMDSYAYLRRLSYMFECRCLGGRLLVCSFGLQNLQAEPEARALLGSVYSYMSSEDFDPAQTLTPEAVQAILKGEI